MYARTDLIRVADPDDEDGLPAPRTRVGLKGYPEDDFFNRDLSMYLDVPPEVEGGTSAPNLAYVSPGSQAFLSGSRRRAGLGSAVPAIVGTAVGGPIGGAVGEVVGGIVGSVFNTGSPRYEGGPLLSSVQNRLGLVRSGDAVAVAQTRSDQLSGGTGWKDVALVLAPAVRPDLFGKPLRALNAQEQSLVASVGGSVTASGSALVSLGNSGGVAGSPNQPTVATAGLFGDLGNLSTGTGLALGAGLLLIALLTRKPRRVAYRRNPHRRRRRR